MLVMGQSGDSIAERVRTRVRREGVDLHGDHVAAERLVREELRVHAERSVRHGQPRVADEDEAAREALAALTGFGAIQPYLDDPDVEEIWLNGPSRVFIAKNGVSELTNTVLTEDSVRDLIERLLGSTGRRVDHSSPFVDASLPDGSRLHIAIPDVTRRHPAINIRKFSRRVRTLGHLVNLGSLTPDAADFLRAAVRSGSSFVVSGGTQSGKTTMLSALLGAARPDERIVTVEETFELDLPGQDVVGLQGRQPSLEGTGEITLRRLVKEALRMRPDRIVVGEVREAEALDLLIAMNSGLPGASSVHANSARDALVKLSTLPLLAGRNIDSQFVRPAVASSIDLVVHCVLDADGRRRVDEILAPTGGGRDGGIEASTVFETRGGALVSTGWHPVEVRGQSR
ncbi:pilus assembly protein CpaF [Labedella gwakjiensis]|uniref:CpaF family protein n=2 Tax=Labedella gwakjiensis TaxID=390269 RepID=A0A2P8H0X4_9MICO|nr:pilus assembly protein CpaF [Labedella gwakjiensis]RUQ85763.1 CpaF family protein [Labedella gwakjiensis]